jgi:hypothetical protein
MHRRCGIHPRSHLSIQLEARKTDQGKRRSFFCEKVAKNPDRRKSFESNLRLIDQTGDKRHWNRTEARKDHEESIRAEPNPGHPNELSILMTDGGKTPAPPAHETPFEKFPCRSGSLTNSNFIAILALRFTVSRQTNRMTWRSLHQKMEADYRVFGSTAVDLPPGDAVAATLASEKNFRGKVDEWCEAYYVRGNADDPVQEIRYWIGWRLHWALGWSAPLAFGPFKDQVVEGSFVGWLLIRCWPYGGVAELDAVVRAAIFDASRPQSLKPPNRDFGISFWE